MSRRMSLRRQQCFQSWVRLYNSLVIECENVDSPLWENLYEEVDKRRRIISDVLNFKSGRWIPITILKYFNKGYSPTQPTNVLSEFVDLMKYGDFLSWIIGSHRSSIKHRRYETLLSCMQCSLNIMNRVLTNNFCVFFPGAESGAHAPQCDLGTLFLIESLEDSELKCLNDLQYIVLSTFMILFCMMEMYGDVCDGESKVCLGALLIFRSNEVMKCLNNLSKHEQIRELKKSMITIIDRNILMTEKSPNMKDANSLYLKMKRWEKFGLRKMGYQMIKQVHSRDIDNMAFANLIIGKIHLNDQKYRQSIPRFIKNIASSSSIYTISLSLRYLSEASDELSQYVIALRLLNVARKLCTMYELTITPTFVNKIYPKERMKIKKKLKKMKCSYCGRKGKLMCCTACMNTVYCSRLCQKKDWKAGHRNKCDKKWSAYYRELKKQRVFDQL